MIYYDHIEKTWQPFKITRVIIGDDHIASTPLGNIFN